MFHGMLIALCLVFSSLAYAANIPGHGTNPAAVEAVAAGELDTADASWWGFDESDSTNAIRRAIRSKAKTVIIPHMGKPWIILPVFLRSNKTIIFEPGVIVMAKKGEFHGPGDSLFAGDDLQNITIRGYGARLVMHKKDYQSPAYHQAEWRMAFRLRSCERITIEGLTIESTGGDAVYIGRSKKSAYSKDIVLRDLKCIDNHRQGISVASVENLLIENCLMEGTGGTNPEAGIDLEPNRPDERLVNIKVRNSIMRNNVGPGIMIHCALFVKTEAGDAAPISIEFENCLIQGGESNGIVVSAIGDDMPEGRIVFRNCTIENVSKLGVNVYGKASGRAHLLFENCTWAYNCADPKDDRAPIHFRLWPDTHAKRNGGVEFINCRVFDDRPRPAIDVDTDEGAHGLFDIHGDITVFNSKGMRQTDWAVPLENVDLKLIDGNHGNNGF